MSARIFHTSDWHLGTSVRGEPRGADHDEVIDEMVEVAEGFNPDLIVHTGDLFDGSRPAHEDLLRALRAVRRLSALAPVIVLAGNHDAPSCFELLAEAVGAPPPAGGWDPYAVCDLPIRFLPKPTTAERGAVATYASAGGTPIRMACLPFVHANRAITGLETSEALPAGNINATYTDKLRQIERSLTEAVFAPGDAGGIVAVWAAHLHVDGALTSSERAIHIAENYATDPAHLDAGYSYLAFGHIHRPQDLPGGRGRYAGSPIEIDFGEEGEAKTVVCVTAEPLTRATITPVELRSGRRIRRIRTSLAALPELAQQVGRDICVVTVDDAPDDIDSLNTSVRDALPEACVVQVIDGRRPAQVTMDELVTGDDPSEESIGTAYRRWLSDGSGDPHLPGAHLERVVELFDELQAAVAAAEPPDVAEAATLDRLTTGELGVTEGEADQVSTAASEVA